MYQHHSLEVLAFPGQPSTVRAPGYQPCHKTVPVLPGQSAFSGWPGEHQPPPGPPEPCAQTVPPGRPEKAMCEPLAGRAV